MPFVREASMVKGNEAYGEYQTTFISNNKQVRADLFKIGNWLHVYVTFPTGLDGGSVTDPYVTELQDYAREQGYDRRMRLFTYET